MGGTSEAKDGIEPIGQEKEGSDSKKEIKTPDREETDQVGGTNSSEGEDEMLTMDVLIRRIVKKGKRLIGECEVSMADNDDQPHSHSKPRGRSPR